MSTDIALVDGNLGLPQATDPGHGALEPACHPFADLHRIAEPRDHFLGHTVGRGDHACAGRAGFHPRSPGSWPSSSSRVCGASHDATPSRRLSRSRSSTASRSSSRLTPVALTRRSPVWCCVQCATHRQQCVRSIAFFGRGVSSASSNTSGLTHGRSNRFSVCLIAPSGRRSWAALERDIRSTRSAVRRGGGWWSWPAGAGYRDRKHQDLSSADTPGELDRARTALDRVRVVTLAGAPPVTLERLSERLRHPISDL
jgi:hypothetical protein